MVILDVGIRVFVFCWCMFGILGVVLRLNNYGIVGYIGGFFGSKFFFKIY